MAFTLKERQILGIQGLLPPALLTQDLQVKRLRANLDKYKDDLEKHIYLSMLQVSGHYSFMEFCFTPRRCSLFRLYMKL